MSIGGEILTALQSRLQTITTGAGYGNTIKGVRLNTSEPTLNASVIDLPLIEIITEGETYEHNASSSYWATTTVILYLVAEKAYTDVQMENLMTDIRKALFGGSANASGNTGVTLGGKVSSMHLVDAVSDLNMIESNRVYMIRIRLRSHRTTYSD